VIEIDCYLPQIPINEEKTKRASKWVPPNFTKEFYEIAERAKSISKEDKSVEFIKSADK